MTVTALLESLAPYQPTVEGDELVVHGDPPVGLLARLEILHTGFRAILSGRKWQGGIDATGAGPCVVDLDPARPIPLGVTLLRVGGDLRWDRLPAGVRSREPELFDHPRTRDPTRLNDSASVWDVDAAIALMTAADGLVERLGVSGSDPVIKCAAELLTIAYRDRDLDRVRFAARSFEDEVRRVAGRRVRESTAGTASCHAECSAWSSEG